MAGSIPHSSSLSAPLIGLFFSFPFPSKVRSFGLAELTAALAADRGMDGGQLFLPQPLSLSLSALASRRSGPVGRTIAGVGQLGGGSSHSFAGSLPNPTTQLILHELCLASPAISLRRLHSSLKRHRNSGKRKMIHGIRNTRCGLSLKCGQQRIADGVAWN